MKKVTLILVLCLLLLIGGSIFYLFYNGVVLLNNPSPARFPVRGVDVSAYQGEIDWPVLSGQDVQFAFIKATEGSSHQDPMLPANLEGASQAGLKYGCYHFFSFDSPGATQADNFLRAVPKTEGMLPPVVDIEFYGEYLRTPMHPQHVLPQLEALLKRLETHYGQTPILYATAQSYDLYLKDRFEAYPLWIRSVIRYPKLSDERPWMFWQYSDRGTLLGYSGPERFIDLNVFNGDMGALERLIAARPIPDEDTFEADWEEFDAQNADQT